MSSNDNYGGGGCFDEDDASSVSVRRDGGELGYFLACEAADRDMALFVASVEAMQEAWSSFTKKRKRARSKSYLFYQKQVQYTGAVVSTIAGELQHVLDSKMYGEVRQS